MFIITSEAIPTLRIEKSDPDEAENCAIIVAVNTGRTSYMTEV